MEITVSPPLVCVLCYSLPDFMKKLQKNEKISKTHLTTGKGFDIIARHLARGAAARKTAPKTFSKKFEKGVDKWEVLW